MYVSTQFRILLIATDNSASEFGVNFFFVDRGCLKHPYSNTIILLTMEYSDLCFVLTQTDCQKPNGGSTILRGGLRTCGSSSI